MDKKVSMELVTVTVINNYTTANSTAQRENQVRLVTDSTGSRLRGKRQVSQAIIDRSKAKVKQYRISLDIWLKLL